MSPCENLPALAMPREKEMINKLIIIGASGHGTVSYTHLTLPTIYSV